jgi:hypothetical protein
MSDTAELQALINAATPGSTINLTPNRVYVVAPPDATPTAAQGVTVSTGPIRMAGSNTVIMQASGVPSSFSSIMVQPGGAGFVLDGVDLYGGAQQPPVEADQHRHGMFIAAAGCRIVNVTSHSHTGDGLYCYIGADSAVFDQCVAHDNKRNGWTLGGACDGVALIECHAFFNGAQQVDTESKSNGQVRNLSLNRCSLSSGQDYALTLGGYGFNVLNSAIDGGINIVGASDGTIERCQGTIGVASDAATITIKGNCSDIRLLGNRFANGTAKRGIWIISTGVGASPNRILVDRCELNMGADGAAGVQISGAISSSVIQCTLRGNGVRVAGRAGISVRSVNISEPIQRFEARECRVQDFGQLGVGFAGLLATPNATITSAYVSGMSFGNSPGRSSLATGIATDNALQNLITGSGNAADPGVALLGPLPAGVTRYVTP